MMRKHRAKQSWFGVVIILIGVLWLLRKMEVAFVPEWVFTWPVFLIVWGIASGIRHRFRDAFSYILILIGSVFLMRNSFGMPITFEPYLWPSLIILIGLIILLKPKNWNRCFPRHHRYHRYQHHWQKRYQHQWQKRHWQEYVEDVTNQAEAQAETEPDSSEMIDTVAVFGAVHKDVISKNFRGGEVVAVFGGTELNLSKADIQNKVAIEVTIAFGGLKLTVPPHWDVRVNTVTIAGGVNDKRRMQAKSEGEEKVLVLTGTLLFGGIEIQSY